MIGQKILKEFCEKWNQDPKMAPALLILAGPVGWGKKTAVEYIRKNVKNDGMLRAENNSVSAVREVIEKSYQLGGAVYYVFTDCDNMSVQAKNAMLKVMEEPPQGARFILTVKNSSSVLGTIKSRAFVYEMYPYSREELEQFVKTYEGKEDVKKVDISRYFITCPGDIVRMASLPEAGAGLVDYADMMADYIGEATQANALKIGTRLDIKGDDPNKYPIDLFLRVARDRFYTNFLRDKKVRDFQCVARIGRALAELSVNTASKQNIIDCLLIDLRRISGGQK